MNKVHLTITKDIVSRAWASRDVVTGSRLVSPDSEPAPVVRQSYQITVRARVAGSANGYRMFSQDRPNRILPTRRIQALDFALGQIPTFMRGADDGCDPETRFSKTLYRALAQIQQLKGLARLGCAPSNCSRVSGLARYVRRRTVIGRSARACWRDAQNRVRNSISIAPRTSIRSGSAVSDHGIVRSAEQLHKGHPLSLALIGRVLPKDGARPGFIFCPHGCEFELDRIRRGLTNEASSIVPVESRLPNGIAFTSRIGLG
jgi:DNA-binding transcriptional MerR regulator